MRTIQMKLWHNLPEKDWTIEINDQVYQHVSSQTLDGLVEYAVVTAQKQLSTRSRPTPAKRKRILLRQPPGKPTRKEALTPDTSTFVFRDNSSN